jgi:DNA-binding GntR family transcriptional regulator
VGTLPDHRITGGRTVNLPTRFEPLFDQIYEILWSNIISGEIQPGSRMSDLEWSGKLNVSRTPVREAMRKLQQDGVLLPLNRGGYEVRRVTAEDVRNLYRCRAALEALATRDAVQNGTQAHFNKLRAIVDQSQKALDTGNFSRAFELNTRFHDQILACSKNTYLERMLKDLRRMILFARSTLMSAANSSQLTEPYISHLHRVQVDHREVLEAIEKGGEQAAAMRMQQHIENTSGDMRILATSLLDGKPNQPDA